MLGQPLVIDNFGFSLLTIIEEMTDKSLHERAQ